MHTLVLNSGWCWWTTRARAFDRAKKAEQHRLRHQGHSSFTKRAGTGLLSLRFGRLLMPSMPAQGRRSLDEPAVRGNTKHPRGTHDCRRNYCTPRPPHKQRHLVLVRMFDSEPPPNNTSSYMIPCTRSRPTSLGQNKPRRRRHRAREPAKRGPEHAPTAAQGPRVRQIGRRQNGAVDRSGWARENQGRGGDGNGDGNGDCKITEETIAAAEGGFHRHTVVEPGHPPRGLGWKTCEKFEAIRHAKPDWLNVSIRVAYLFSPFSDILDI